MRENFFLTIFFTRGDPYNFSGFFDVFLFRKHSKMTFLEKKFQGCLKKFQIFFPFFSSNSQFSSSETRGIYFPQKSEFVPPHDFFHLNSTLLYLLATIGSRDLLPHLATDCVRDSIFYITAHAQLLSS